MYMCPCPSAHTHTDVPDTVIMESHEEIGELSGHAQLELSFSYDFTNVLCVHTRLHLHHGDKTAQARLEYDIKFLVSVNIRLFYLLFGCMILCV